MQQRGRAPLQAEAVLALLEAPQQPPRPSAATRTQREEAQRRATMATTAHQQMPHDDDVLLHPRQAEGSESSAAQAILPSTNDHGIAFKIAGHFPTRGLNVADLAQIQFLFPSVIDLKIFVFKSRTYNNLL